MPIDNRAAMERMRAARARKNYAVVLRTINILRHKYESLGEVRAALNTISEQEYLDAVSPEYASISCGRGNKYGHPHEETVEKLEEMGVEYYRTDLSGNITFTSDGENISVRTEKP